MIFYERHREAITNKAQSVNSQWKIKCKYYTIGSAEKV